MKTKYFTTTQQFDGAPKLSDFQLVEEEIDETISEEEALTQALCISVDPFIRIVPNPPGEPVVAFQTARVLKSNISEYPDGSIVMFYGGWKTISKVKKEEVWFRVDKILPEKHVSYSVGAVGMPGLAAYIGTIDFCRPEEGNTLMVNACTGAVGSLVGQIAKIKKCKVVGCCGSEEKIAFAKSLGFDAVFNYKTDKPWSDALKRVAPSGIDCFFDNVGGQMASDIIAHMNLYGRIACCGFITAYNSSEPVKADMVQGSFVAKQLQMGGFGTLDPKWRSRFPEISKQMAEWVESGQIQVHETITHGFENLPKAFIDMLSGVHMGKAVVKV